MAKAQKCRRMHQSYRNPDGHCRLCFPENHLYSGDSRTSDDDSNVTTAKLKILSDHASVCVRDSIVHEAGSVPTFSPMSTSVFVGAQGSYNGLSGSGSVSDSASVLTQDTIYEDAISDLTPPTPTLASVRYMRGLFNEEYSESSWITKREF